LRKPAWASVNYRYISDTGEVYAGRSIVITLTLTQDGNFEADLLKQSQLIEADNMRIGDLIVPES